MEKFEHDFCDVDGEALRDYRLDPGPFYFKLAASSSCSVDATTMVPGMYIPLAYWRRILADPVSKGERDGVRITREAAGRWITNTLFVELVQDGWIGSRTCVELAVATVPVRLSGSRTASSHGRPRNSRT